MTELLAYLGTGAVAGLLAGLLGVGGGLVIVPALAALYAMGGFPPDSLMHYAVGSSLATIVPTSIASLVSHHRRGGIHWLAVQGMTPGIVLGALGGAWFAVAISSPALRLLFGGFELLVALQLLAGRQPAAHRALPGAAGLGFAGGVIGAVSALLGIGGGTLTVPFLLWNGVDILRSVATSAACGLPIALAGAAAFAVEATDGGALPAGMHTGFVYWPAVVGIASTSILAAPLGARLAHYLPKAVLQRIFAFLLALIGLRMVSG
jgi:uncharacterized membrane protein YfcA